jgi:hypothetical protein
MGVLGPRVPHEAMMAASIAIDVRRRGSMPRTFFFESPIPVGFPYLYALYGSQE